MKPFLEGLVKTIARVAYVLADEPDAVALYRDHNLAALLIKLEKRNHGMTCIIRFHDRSSNNPANFRPR